MFGIDLYYVIGIAAIILAAIVVGAILTKRTRSRLDGRSLYISALQSLLDGDQVDAFYKLKETVGQDSDNIDAYLRLGRILAARGKVEQAIQIHSDLLLRPKLPERQLKAIHNCLVEDYVIDNQNDRAIELLSKLYERNRTDRKTGLRLLELLSETGKWSDAELVAEKLYKQDRQAFAVKLAEVKIKIGDSLVEESDFKKARSYYKAASGLDSDAAEVWVKIGDSYLKENRVENAIESWRHLTEAQPGKAYLVFDRLMKSLFELGQFNAINGILEGVLEKDPSNREAAMAMADLYAKKGNYSQAEEHYRHVLEEKPDYIPAALGIARIYREQGRTDEALDILEKVHFSEEMVSRES